MAHVESAYERLAIRRDFPSMRKMIEELRQSDQLARLLKLPYATASTPIAMDRRVWNRFLIQIPVQLIPADFDGQFALIDPTSSGSMLAMTRDVSLRGAGLMHDEPLEAQYIVVTFDLLDGQSSSILLELRWSNLRHNGSYMSGGMFLAITDPPNVPIN